MRILKKTWWLPLLIYMILMPSFISDKVYQEACRSIDIRIVDSADYGFVTSADIFSKVHNDNNMILGNPIDEINLAMLETRIGVIKELESVEVYRTVDGVLHIDADQRDPLVRIITSFGNSFYLDNDGEIIPHSKAYTPRVTVVSGNLSIPDKSIAEGNIRSLSEDSMIWKLVNLIHSINEREFWKGQIEQLWVTEKGNIEIIPRVGNHIVKIGQAEDFDKKLDYLEVLYSDALPLVGWNKYREINLMYEGQIVCKKR